jgi:hypothetical protein
MRREVLLYTSNEILIRFMLTTYTNINSDDELCWGQADPGNYLSCGKFPAGIMENDRCNASSPVSTNPKLANPSERYSELSRACVFTSTLSSPIHRPARQNTFPATATARFTERPGHAHSRDSSVRIATGWTAGVRFPATFFSTA